MKKILLLMAVLATSTVQAALQDLQPANFRTAPPGQGSTTMQGWSFDNSANKTAPEVVYNNFGTPVLSVTGGTYLNSYLNRVGIWRYTAIGQMSIYIPNTGDNSPNTYKDIWLQIIYADPAGANVELPIVTDPEYATLQRVSSQYLNGTEWIHDIYKIHIVPNPPGEELLTFSIQCAIYIDEVVVDTICVPEPATMLLLGLGAVGLGLLRKRG